VIGQVFLVAGCAFVCVAALGVVRFPDVLARLHAVGKASTMGIFLVCVGGAIALAEPQQVTQLLLAAALQFLAVPVSTTLISRASYGARSIARDLEAGDALAAQDAEPRRDDDGEGGQPGA
jgi:multicomponent Na+:H+ antiporter subunit G